MKLDLVNDAEVRDVALTLDGPQTGTDRVDGRGLHVARLSAAHLGRRGTRSMSGRYCFCCSA